MSTSKEHSYRFNREMTRAVLDGRKTQTRRPIKPQPYLADDLWLTEFEDYCGDPVAVTDPRFVEMCLYGNPGDTFRLSEAVHVQSVDHERYSLLFEADLMHCERYGDPAMMERIRKYKRGMLRGCTLPPAFCRSQRWEITRRWVERLNEISYEDAESEGIERLSNGWRDYLGDHPRWMSSITSFQSLWMSIYGHDSWNANPWVWVVEFRKIEV